MLRNRLLFLTPVIAFVVVFIFSLALFPSVQPQPKNLPIAIVNLDRGVEIPQQPKMNMGQTMVEMMKKSSETTQGKTPAVKWVEVKSIEEVRKDLDDQKYYGALVIPQDFSAKLLSLRTANPASPEVQIYINQGMNAAASTIAGQILNGVVDRMNGNIHTQLLQWFASRGATVTVKQASHLATPITKQVTNVHPIGKNSANGNAPVSLFQPLWISTLASAVISCHQL